MFRVFLQTPTIRVMPILAGTSASIEACDINVIEVFAGALP
jgi:hypothetical protein